MIATVCTRGMVESAIVSVWQCQLPTALVDVLWMCCNAELMHIDCSLHLLTISREG